MLQRDKKWRVSRKAILPAHSLQLRFINSCDERKPSNSDSTCLARFPAKSGGDCHRRVSPASGCAQTVRKKSNMRFFRAAFLVSIWRWVARSGGKGVSLATSTIHSRLKPHALSAVTASTEGSSATFWHITASRVRSNRCKICSSNMMVSILGWAWG